MACTNCMSSIIARVNVRHKNADRDDISILVLEALDDISYRIQGFNAPFQFYTQAGVAIYRIPAPEGWSIRHLGEVKIQDKDIHPRANTSRMENHQFWYEYGDGLLQLGSCLPIPPKCKVDVRMILDPCLDEDPCFDAEWAKRLIHPISIYVTMAMMNTDDQTLRRQTGQKGSRPVDRLHRQYEDLVMRLRSSRRDHGGTTPIMMRALPWA